MSVSISQLSIETSGTAPKCKLYLFGEDDHSPVDEFLKELYKSRIADFAKFFKLFRIIVQHGKITNDENFKDVEGHKPLFEFKAESARIYCFYDAVDILILIEGDHDKKSNKSRRRNMQCIARAERRVKLYWQEKRSGRLEVIE